MLGSIIGDIAGSVYEFNNYRAKDFAPFFHAQAAFTDDTVCTIAIAALTCVFEANSFEDAIRNAISIGGDSDTVAAIAGGVAEAMFGIPEEIAVEVWSRLPEDMRCVLTRLYSNTECLG